MRQGLGLDRPRVRAYLGLGVGALLHLGCTPRVAPLAPAALPRVSRDTVVQWINDLTPSRSRVVDLRWRYETQKGGAAGRAAGRVAPPDSLRFDYRAPFGRSGAAVIIGDSVHWIEPRGDFDWLVQIAPLFWAALGIPRPPPADAVLWGGLIEERRVWRYEAASGTVEFRHAPRAGRLEAQVRRGDGVAATLLVEFDKVTNLPATATLRMPAEASRFTLTVERVDTLANHDRGIWQRR